MEDPAIIRRKVLSALVERDGLSNTAKRFGKPDRQLNDMLAGRKSFGEKVARAMELRYSPDRAPGWLSLLNETGITKNYTPEIKDPIQSAADYLSGFAPDYMEIEIAKIRAAANEARQKKQVKTNEESDQKRNSNSLDPTSESRRTA